MPCPLCADPGAAGDLVYEDDGALVLLHPDWSVRGHAMVVSKRHVENASDLDDEEWRHFTRVWHRAERLLLELTGSERAIILKLGIQTPHLHVHIYPVGADASREAVFAAIDGNVRVPRDEELVTRLRSLLTPTAP